MAEARPVATASAHGSGRGPSAGQSAPSPAAAAGNGTQSHIVGAGGLDAASAAPAQSTPLVGPASVPASASRTSAVRRRWIMVAHSARLVGKTQVSRRKATLGLMDNRRLGPGGGGAASVGVDSHQVAALREELHFHLGAALKESLLMIFLPVSPLVYGLVFGRGFLQQRMLWPRLNVPFVSQMLVSTSMWAAVLTRAGFGDESGFYFAEVGHALLLHFTWAAMVSFKYSMTRGTGAAPPLDARTWNRGDPKTLLSQTLVAQGVSEVQLDAMHCVIHPRDMAHVKLLLRPALELLPDLAIDWSSGEFPAQLLLLRVLLCQTPACQKWEREVLNVDYNGAKAKKKWIRLSQKTRNRIHTAVALLVAGVASVAFRAWEDGAFAVHHWAFIIPRVLLVLPLYIHYMWSVRGTILGLLTSDLERRGNTIEVFSNMLNTLDGKAPDPRMVDLDMLVPDNLVAWFWCRDVASNVASDMLARAQFYACILAFWISVGIIATMMKAFDTTVELDGDTMLLILYTTTYATLFVVALMDVTKHGGRVNSEDTVNALTLLRTRVRVAEFLYRTRAIGDPKSMPSEVHVQVQAASPVVGSGGDGGTSGTTRLSASAATAGTESVSAAAAPEARSGSLRRQTSQGGVGLSRMLHSSHRVVPVEPLESTATTNAAGAQSAGVGSDAVDEDRPLIADDSGAATVEEEAYGHSGGALLDDPQEGRRMLAESLMILDSVKEEMQVMRGVHPIRLLGIPMGPPLLSAIFTVLTFVIGVGVSVVFSL